MKKEKKEKQENQTRSLKDLVQNLNKNYGDGAVLIGMQGMRMDVPVISTGAPSLDAALGVGGIPRGRVSEIFGHESCGKTTLCLHLIANAQKDGGAAAFIDVEHALDPAYARNLGVNVDDLLLSQPDSGEQAMSLVEGLIESRMLDIVVIDSVAALATKSELEGEVGDNVIGAKAKLMSRALNRITPILNKTNTALVFINQTRCKIGYFVGDPEETPGGKALKFFASCRIKMNKVQTLKDGEKAIGNIVEAKVVKNKVAPPFTKARFDIYFGKGISYEASILDVAASYHIIQKNGSFLIYNDVRLGNGKAQAIVFLKENPNICMEIKDKISGKLKEITGDSVEEG